LARRAGIELLDLGGAGCHPRRTSAGSAIASSANPGFFGRHLIAAAPVNTAKFKYVLETAAR
jgi:hypothetical protein